VENSPEGEVKDLFEEEFMCEDGRSAGPWWVCSVSSVDDLWGIGDPG
jgi:hypothetical protein